MRGRGKTRANHEIPVIGRADLILFGSGFLLSGGVATWIIVSPIFDIVGALNWVETPCRILSSEVGGKRSSGTYRVEVGFEYVVEGVTHRSSRYHFFTGRTGGYEGKAKIVRALPPGTETTCHVNPDDPREAVLNRGLTWEFLYGLIPLVFVCVGALVLYSGIRRISPEEAAELDAEKTVAEKPVRSTELKPYIRPMTQFLFALATALFWNFLVGILVSYPDGWSGKAFMIPLVLVGICIVLGAGYCFLCLFNPEARMRLDSSQLRAGQSSRLWWCLEGKPGRVRKVRIVLEGVEVVGAGDDSKHRVFAKITLVEIDALPRHPRGVLDFDVPADSQPTITSSRRKVTWSLKIKGKIPWWPDVNTSFPIEMLPGRSD